MGISETGTRQVMDEFTKGVDIDAMAREIVQLRADNKNLDHNVRMLTDHAGGTVTDCNKQLNDENVDLKTRNELLNKGIAQHRQRIKDLMEGTKELEAVCDAQATEIARLTEGKGATVKLSELDGESKIIPFKKDKKRKGMSAKGRKNISRAMKKSYKERARKKEIEMARKNTALAKATKVKNSNRKKPTRMTDEIHAELVELRNAGFTLKEVAEEVGVSTFSVHHYAKIPVGSAQAQMEIAGGDVHVGVQA